jgi:hypothetical protein
MRVERILSALNTLNGWCRVPEKPHSTPKSSFRVVHNYSYAETLDSLGREKYLSYPSSHPMPTVGFIASANVFEFTRKIPGKHGLGKIPQGQVNLPDGARIPINKGIPFYHLFDNLKHCPGPQYACWKNLVKVLGWEYITKIHMRRVPRSV